MRGECFHHARFVSKASENYRFPEFVAHVAISPMRGISSKDQINSCEEPPFFAISGARTFRSYDGMLSRRIFFLKLQKQVLPPHPYKSEPASVVFENLRVRKMVEHRRFELLTCCVRCNRSTN